jgi:outer membrane lipoprotein-sorting protein
MKSIISITLVTICVLISIPTEAQQAEADKLLAEVQENIKQLEPLEAELELIIDFPEEGEEKQMIQVKQQGKKYRVKLDNMLIISDGETRWTYLEAANEVQIDRAASADFQMGSLQGWIEMMGAEEYTYAITGEEMVDGKEVLNIEFKPNDPASQYSKARIRVSKKEKLPVTMEAFEKTGTTYILKSNTMKSLAEIDPREFLFNAEDYPGVFIEDLRID